MPNGGEKHSGIRRNIFRKIFLLMLVPVLCSILTSVLTYYYYFQRFEREVTDGYVSHLETIAENTNNIFYEIYKTNMLLSADKNLTGVINSSEPLPEEEFYRISGCIDSLKVFRTTKNMIDNAYIVFKPQDLVIGCNGATPINNFFDKDYSYQQYPKVFWLGLALKAGEFRILNPSRVDNLLYQQNQKNIIPIVQSGLGGSLSRNLFVVNINQEEFSEMLGAYRMTPNSLLLVADRDGNVFAANAGESTAASYEDKGVLELIQNKETGIHDAGGRKMLIINRVSNVMARELIYTACVPMEDIYDKTASIKNLGLIVCVLTLLLTTGIAFLLAKRMYSPIRNLVHIMEQKADVTRQPAGDEMDFLNNGIRKIISDTENLSEDLSHSLPLVCEQYLQNMLNQNEFFEEERMEDILRRGGIVFRHPYFQVMLMQLTFTKSFYESFRRDEQLMVYSGTIKLVRGLFPEEYQVFIVSMEKDKICIVLNLPEGETVERMEEKVRALYDLYSADREWMESYTGIGLIHGSMSGMHESYREAMSALSMLSPYGRDRIRVYRPEKTGGKYLYSLDEENKLFNYLMSGRKDDVNALLNSILNANIRNGIPDAGMKELYLQIYLTGQRVLNSRNLTAEALMGGKSMDLTGSYILMSPKEIIDYVASLFEKITDMHGGDRSTIDVPAIKAFIDEHFNEDIYLEKLAGQYNTSAAYLSRLLKSALGMSFNQYLAALRIARAKHLLSVTGKQINDIALETGFNSRNTFIRMFKKHEGVLPSEYRQMMRNSG